MGNNVTEQCHNQYLSMTRDVFYLSYLDGYQKTLTAGPGPEVLILLEFLKT
jgi:hypothetical protein